MPFFFDTVFTFRSVVFADITDFFIANDIATEIKRKTHMGLSPERLKKLAEASATGGGDYIQHGVYDLALNKMEIKDGHKGLSFIFEWYVLSGEPAKDGRQSKLPHNKTGSRCSVGLNTTKHEVAANNLKALVEGLLGKANFDALMQDERLGVHKAVRYGQLLDNLTTTGRGLMVHNETYLDDIKSGKNQGEIIAKHKWFTMVNDETSIARNIAIMDGKLPVSAHAEAMVALQAAAAQASAGGATASAASPAA